MSNSIIRAIKQSIADALLGDPFFANIPVMPIVANEIQTQLQEGQYRAHPLTVFVDWISLHNSDVQTPGPWFNNGAFIIEVLELPSMNDTGVDVDEVAENVANILQMNQLDSDNTVVVDGITKLDNDEWQRNSRLVAVSFPFGFKPRNIPQIAPVVISPLTQGNQSVLLSCVTPGAAIFYTLDGSYPAPRNPAARFYGVTVPLLDDQGNTLRDDQGNVLYSGGPIAVLAGQLLKARAWLAGYRAATPDTSQFQY